ncbi:acylase, partial [bacterium]|nr:acylase [bacterium]
VSNGLHPARPRGDADFWAGVVDGSDPSLLWTGYLPYERLLRVADPASGFVQNSNEPGFTATMPPALDPADFPADFVSPYMRTRPQHGLEMLLGDGSISFDELIDYSRDTRLTLADNVLDDLIAAARADSRDQALRAADVLARWDRRSNVESRGAALFSLWTFAYAASPGGFEYDRPWSFDAPMAWPEGIGNEAAAVEALVATAGRIEGAGAPIDVAWGAVAQVPDGEGATMPSSLGIGGAGAFRVGFFSPREDALTFAFNGGTSYVAAVEFG